VKNAEDAAIKKHSAAVRNRHLGIRPRSRFQSAGFRKAPPQHTASTPLRRKSERQTEDME
jgi:hypothetical protein